MCGIMDQYISSCGVEGHALAIDCRRLTFESVPVPSDVAIIVTQTRASHSLSDSPYNERVNQCNEAVRRIRAYNPESGAQKLRDITNVDELRQAMVAALQEQHNGQEGLSGEAQVEHDPVFRRARHVITENLRVRHFNDHMKAGDYAAAGQCPR